MKTPYERALGIVGRLRFVDPYDVAASMTVPRLEELLKEETAVGASMRMLVEGVTKGIVDDRAEVEADRRRQLDAPKACAIVGCSDVTSSGLQLTPADRVLCKEHFLEWCNRGIDVDTWVRAKNRTRPKVEAGACSIANCTERLDSPWRFGDDGQLCDGHANEYRAARFSGAKGDVTTWVQEKNRFITAAEAKARGREGA